VGECKPLVLGKQIGDSPDQEFGDPIEITVKVLDNALRHNISSVKVIKIDIEGYECIALVGRYRLTPS